MNGYHMPAEWEPHDAVWLAWPYDITTFPGDRLEKAEQTYIEIINAIHTTEAVHLLVRSANEEERIRALVPAHNVITHVMDYGDVWFRDYGPTFVINDKEKTLGMVNWIFNAWGNKYPKLLKDDAIPDAMNALLNLPMMKPNIVMEGGSFDVNGEGVLLTTRECLLNKNRNPRLTQAEIEQSLKDYLGVFKIVWLNRGIAGNDDTDGHIDDIARFVNASTVVCAWTDPDDENFETLKENYDLLAEFTRIKLPTPIVTTNNGERLAASYTNFYIGNGKVLLPTFDHPYDQEATQIIQSCFPDREVIGIYCTDILYAGCGTLHCISQQQPRI